MEASNKLAGNALARARRQIRSGGQRRPRADVLAWEVPGDVRTCSALENDLFHLSEPVSECGPSLSSRILSREDCTRRRERRGKLRAATDADGSTAAGIHRACDADGQPAEWRSDARNSRMAGCCTDSIDGRIWQHRAVETVFVSHGRPACDGRADYFLCGERGSFWCESFCASADRAVHHSRRLLQRRKHGALRHNGPRTAPNARRARTLRRAAACEIRHGKHRADEPERRQARADDSDVRRTQLHDDDGKGRTDAAYRVARRLSRRDD